LPLQRFWFATTTRFPHSRRITAVAAAVKSGGVTCIEDVMDLRVAIVGYGSIGRRHCENLGRLGVARRVVVRRSDAVNMAFAPPVNVVVVHSVPKSIESGVDLAIVCNPTSLHIATARQYLTAGVPVLIEKPLAAELSEAERFIVDADASGVPVSMAYCMRYHPAYAMAHEYVSQGRLGRIQSVEAWFECYLPDWHPWEDYRQSYAVRADLGGGVLPTLDHEIDFINWCCGLPTSFSTTTSRSAKLDTDVDDTAQVMMRYSGYSAEIKLSMAEPNQRRGFEFVGEGGMLRFSFEQQRLEMSCGGKSTVLWHEPDFDLNTIYLAMLGDAVGAIAARRPLPVALRAGLEALRIAGVAHGNSQP
jgi:predicted dehydrogenase